MLRLTLTAGLLLTCSFNQHWRALGKGCFTPDTEVTLANGLRRPLGEIQIGDKVHSWDEQNRRTVESTVKAVPSFERTHDELVEVVLPNSSIFATEDHPFWSLSQGALVSLRPEVTNREYQLEVLMMEHNGREELEGEAQQPVPVTAIKRPSVTARSLRSSEETLTVMTLCLEPHHWFYAGGVRVHNKGCFVGTSKVTMADGVQKQIQDVEVGDAVKSWDELRARPTASRVKDVLEFNAYNSNLVNISLNGSSILATLDHPFWSRSRGTLVSMDPTMTLDKYGLPALQLQLGEELEDEWQRPVNVTSIRQASFDEQCPSEEEMLRIQMSSQTKVVTLKLAGHHWFYVEGVRVHNKGMTGTQADGAKPEKTYSREDFDSNRDYVINALLVFGGTRRRYGTYDAEDEGTCDYYEISYIETLCGSTIAPNSSDFNATVAEPPVINESTNCLDTAQCCHSCMACEDEDCMNKIVGCTAFLAEMVVECWDDAATGPEVLMILGGIAVALAIALWIFIARSRYKQRKERVRVEKLLEEELAFSPCRGDLPPFLVLSGEWLEEGEPPKKCTYKLKIGNDGTLGGRSSSSEFYTTVTGQVSDGLKRVVWKEQHHHATMVVKGEITVGDGRVSIQASWVSDFRHGAGTLVLSGRLPSSSASAGSMFSEDSSPQPPMCEEDETVIGVSLLSERT